ncbi:MAG: putative Ig domain-containing protein, partial [Aquincola tertiaricarbonis]
RLDDHLSLRSFRLGDLRIGGINVSMPPDRANYQGDIDLRNALGFILRISAGVDPVSRTASWVLQAIDPLTGEVMRDATRGLLPPDNSQGRGAGFVSYSVQAAFGATTGQTVSAKARVALDTRAVMETAAVTHMLDAGAPVTTLSAVPMGAGSPDVLVKWQAQDGADGSGLRHTSVYVRTDGGDWTLWLRQVPPGTTEALFQGQAGHNYAFMALSTDLAGNRERPASGGVPDDGTQVELGELPDAGTPTQDTGTPPAPTNATSTNALFTQAEAQLPAQPADRPALFEKVLAPFGAEQFATGIGLSISGIGPLAITERPDGSFIVSGGMNRGALYLFDQDGGHALQPAVALDQPVYDFGWDANGGLWATTGGGALLELDPVTLQIINRYGDGLTQSLVFSAAEGVFYVSSGDGIERFDPVSRRFTHFSNVRVDDLAIAPDGTLWGTGWPRRGEVLSFNALGKASVQFRLDGALDSLAFGRAGTPLQGLLFVSSRIPSGSAAGAALHMVDLFTRRSVMLGQGGPSAEQLLATRDGRLLIANGSQVDVVAPLVAPSVLRTGPVAGSLVALPMASITVTFDRDMRRGDAGMPDSVLNPANYRLTDSLGRRVQLAAVSYDAATRTATLRFESPEPDHYQLVVDKRIRSTGGLELTAPYTLAFTAVQDFSPLVKVEFVATRADRSTGQVSFDVRVTNLTAYELRAPLLALNPARYFAGSAVGAAVRPDGLWLLDIAAGLPGGVLAAGASTLVHTVTLNNPLGQHVEMGSGVYALPYPNQAPVFSSVPPQQAQAGTAWQYAAQAADADGAVVTYVLLQGPEGLSLDAQTGVLRWTPTADSLAQTPVVLRAYDTRGGYATQVFTIEVAGGNRAPTLDLPPSVRLREGQAWSLGVAASDPEGRVLSYWVDQLPPGARFDAQRGVLEWTPGFDAAGDYPDVRFSVSDGRQTVTRSVRFIVDQVNAPPVLAGIPDRLVRQGDPVRFALQGTDADGGAPRYSALDLPAGATLHAVTGEFRWTPGYEQSGTFSIRFRATDDAGGSTERLVRLTVLEANAAPVFDSFSNLSVLEGQPLALRLFAFDPDNPRFVPQVRLADGELSPPEATLPSVSYGVGGLPPGAEFDTVTGLLRWTPGFTQAGSWQVTVTATDDGGGTGTPMSASATVTLLVRNANRPPVLPEIPTQHVAKGQVLNLPIAATDADGNPVTLSFDQLPRFATWTPDAQGGGLLTLAPGARDRGDYVVTLTARDDGDGGGAKAALSTSRSFVISADSDAEPPLLQPTGPKVAVIGQALQFTLRATDLDQDALGFSHAGLPPGATLTPGTQYGTAVFRWTPTAAQAGVHDLQFTVTDSTGLSDQLSVRVLARASNAAPLLLPVGDRSVAEGELMQLQLAARDSDGDPLTWSATNLPPGAVLDSATGLLTWQTNLFSAGRYAGVVLTVSDGASSSSETIAITVTPTNQAPLLALMPPLGGQEQQLLQFSLVATDPDGEGLLYSALSPLPAGAFFDTGSGRFQWTPGHDQAGDYTLVFAARDAAGAQDTVEVRLSIADANRAPVLAFSNHQVQLGQTLQFDVGMTDPDSGAVLTLLASGLPDGASVDAQTGRFSWTPSAGQIGDHLVMLRLTDGRSIVERGLALRVAAQPQGPDVTIVLTPSFPAVPGQPVAITVLADAFSALAGRS